MGNLHNSLVISQAYLLSRTQAGWAPVSFGPPSWRYYLGDMLDTAADLGSSLWLMDTLGQPDAFDLYLEQPLGTFAKIGPLTPGRQQQAGYLGASNDLSRVLFTAAPASRWSFDGTAASGGTLYEYTGVERLGETREPSLVGVEGGRESRALISRCSTRLGSSSTEEGASGYGSAYNAISASGERVFFTAIGAHHDECGLQQPPVDEVFVREAMPSPAEARSPEMRTLPISCPAAPLSPCADANFEGASRDGSKVFFTSTGKLLPGASEDRVDSAQECSATTEPGGCNLYEDELTGSGASLTQRLTLVSTGSADPEVQGVARISQDGSHVYFVARGRLTEAPNGLGRRALAGEDNLYVYAGGHVSFIATLSPGDAADWSHTDERPVLASDEGRYLVFTSVDEHDLTNEGVSPGKPQVFQYDAQAGVLARASIGQEGYNDNGREPAVGSAIRNRFSNSYGDNATDSPTQASASSAAANGAVFFESPDPLTPQALSDQQVVSGSGKLVPVPNVYEYRAGHVYLLSDGRDVSIVEGSPSVSLVGSDATGGDVFFFSSDSLIPGDGNTQQALYDARVEGGFPAPAPSLGCTEACQGALAGAPAPASPGGSATQTAEVPAVTSAPATAKAKAKTVSRRPKPRRSRRRARTRRKAGSRVALHGRAHRGGLGSAPR